MKTFLAPRKSLGDLDADAAASLVSAAADMALVVDEQGVIRDIAFSSQELSKTLGGHQAWLGRPWAETVTTESRPKVEALLSGAPSESKWRNINQVAEGGEAVPLLFAAVPLQRGNRRVVFGRDLSAQSRLQQRLLETQQSMERDYAKLRQAETRYRLLFQLSADATLIIDGATGRVTEANPAAEQLFGRQSRRVIGRPLMDAFAPESRQAVQSLLASVRIAGRGDEVGAQLADSGRDVTIAATSFRQDGASVLLVRLSLAGGEQPAGLSPAKAQMLKVAENLPDAFVVTDQNGLVMSANGAFLDLAELGSEEQARGESLERWLGGQGIEIEVLLSNLRNRGTVRLYTTTLRGAMGARVEVEISAVTVTHGGQEVFGFSIRDIGARVAEPRQAGAHATRSVEQLTELIGRVPLKDLVRDATDAIERLCIEAALQLSGDNRASAAEMLGLSRQSLYVKLHRYGLGDLGADSGEQG